MLTSKVPKPVDFARSAIRKMQLDIFSAGGRERVRYVAWRHVSLVAGSALALLLIVLITNSALASGRHPERRGKVIIIRGAFTVFSLGMNTLGKKLEQHGLDVQVIADISARRVASELKSEYRKHGNVGPIVFIGHSRGAELGPKQARYLGQYDIPVKLVVMVDAVHQTSIPANVERCVNLYHDKALSLVHGVPARPESRKTKMMNVDIDKLSSRQRGGSINHFNIDASPWIHDLVIREVLKACPVDTSHAKSNIARKPTPAAEQKPFQVTVRWRSPSGLMYPKRIVAGLWALPTESPAPRRKSAAQHRSSRTRQSMSERRENRKEAGTKRRRLRDDGPSLESSGNAEKPAKTRTAKRAETSGAQEPGTGGQTHEIPRKPRSIDDVKQNSDEENQYARKSKSSVTDAPKSKSSESDDAQRADSRDHESSDANTKTSSRPRDADSEADDSTTPTEKTDPPIQAQLNG